MKTLARPECYEEIIGRLKTVRPGSARRWGRMSAHQAVCHLADGCRMAIGVKPVAASGRLFHRTLLKWIVLYGPLRWPAGVPTSPEIDQRCAGTRPADFAADVSELERLLSDMTRRPADVAWPPHPVFGRLTRSEWLRWAYLHADHHLRQFGA